jgi:hypothetical protein
VTSGSGRTTEGKAADIKHPTEAERTYARSVALLRMVVALGLLVGSAATGWLIRTVVIRVREYSKYSTRVGAGELNSWTRPRAHDELTDLG